jgi:hypothetical protein
MKRSKWMLLSTLFVALLAISMYGSYSFSQMPLTRPKNNVDLQYVQNADYTYIAFVKPSLVYDNRTEISEGEPLYIKLVEQLNVTLQYNLTQYPNPLEMKEVELRYNASASLSGADWVKTYPMVFWKMNAYSFTESYTIDLKEIDGIVDKIGAEIGTHVYSYTYEIQPRISLKASAGNETIQQEFNPTLKIKFEGGKIDFEGLANSKADSITHLETEATTTSLLGYTVGVMNMRIVSILASISFTALLYIPMRRTLQERASRTFLQRLSGDIRDKIIESKEPLERIEREKIVVSSLDDLAKVSEETFKPIIHYGNIFYVLDGDVRYEFLVKSEPDVEKE